MLELTLLIVFKRKVCFSLWAKLRYVSVSVECEYFKISQNK